MKVAVIGSRSFANYEQLVQALDALAAAEARSITCIVSGGAVGTDTLAERYARERSIPTRVFLPDYQAHGRAGPLIRNHLIVQEAEVLLACWQNASRGTAHALGLALRKRGLRVVVVEPLS